MLHTDGQPGYHPETWNAITTWWGLAGGGKLVHFAVGQDRVMQMLPMYADTVMHCIGTEPHLSSEGLNLDFGTNAIQIEMAGRDDDAVATGEDSTELAATVKAIAKKTIHLVLVLMEFYKISIGNIMGH